MSSNTTKKKYLVMEMFSDNLSISHDNDSAIRLSGIFTQFNTKNRNGRTYFAEDFVPHIEQLQEKVKTNTLLGELDHPAGWEVSLANVSHVIEELTYDKENQQILGKIRLLNTTKGREAQALVNDGIPLHISSRASGSVDANGRVTLESLFTYDLVSDPGFACAELHRVNESLGCAVPENTLICELSDEPPAEPKNMEEEKKNDKENKKNPDMTPEELNESKEALTVPRFQRYTEYITGVLQGISDRVAKVEKRTGGIDESFSISDNTEIKDLKEKVDIIAQYLDKLSECFNTEAKHNMRKHSRAAKRLGILEGYAEKTGNTITVIEKYQDEVADRINLLEDYSNHVKENFENLTKFAEYLGENIDRTQNYCDYIKEHVSSNEQATARLSNYSDMLSEAITNLEKYQDVIKEDTDYMKGYTQYLRECINNTGKYAEFIAEELESANATPVKECGTECNKKDEEEQEPITENADKEELDEAKTLSAYKDILNERLDAAIKKTKTSVSENKEVNIIGLLSESQQTEFSKLPTEQQTMITEALVSSNVKNAAQAAVVWNKVYESKKTLDIVSCMPAVCFDAWNKLSPERKANIIKESEYYNLDSKDAINEFWMTRDLRENVNLVRRENTDSAKIWERQEQEDSVMCANIDSIIEKAKRI